MRRNLWDNVEWREPVSDCSAEAWKAAIDAKAEAIAAWNEAIEAWNEAIKAWNTCTHGTLTAKQVSKAVYAHSIHADCADADWQAIADELNATMGNGTCHTVEDSGLLHCSECGGGAEKRS